MKNKRILFRVISVILALMIVLPSIPFSVSAGYATVGSLSSGINIIREASILNTDIASDETVIITPEAGTVIFNKPIRVEGRIICLDDSISFGSKTETRYPITFMGTGALCYGATALFGSSKVSLKDVKEIEEFKPYTETWPETAVPTFSLSEDASVVYGYRLNSNSENEFSTAMDFTAGKITQNRDYSGSFGADNRFTVEKNAEYVIDGNYSIKDKTNKINFYNKSTKTSTVNALNKLAAFDGNVTVKHLVSQTVDSSSDEKYIKSGEKFVFTPQEGYVIDSVSVDGALTDVKDESKYETTVTKPFSVYFGTKIKQFNVKVNVTNEIGGVVTDYAGTVNFGTAWSANIAPLDGYYYEVKIVDKDGKDVTFADNGAGVTVDSVMSDLTVSVVFSVIKATEIKIVNENTKFYPNGVYTFKSEVIPSTAIHTSVVWSIESTDEGISPKDVVIDSSTGKLSIGANVATGTEFFVVAQDKNDITIRQAKKITVGVETSSEIDRYFLFNGEKYDENKWYGSNVIVSLTENAIKDGYSFVINTKGNDKKGYYFAGQSDEVFETTENIQFRLFKGTPDTNLEVIDIEGEYKILIDTDKPVFDAVNVEYDPIGGYENWGNSATVTVKVSDIGSGVKSLQYRPVGAETFTTVAKSEENTYVIEFSEDTDKNNRYEFVVTDNAGLTETREQIINIDNTAPEIKVSYNTDSAKNFVEIITFGLLNLTSKASFKFDAVDSGCGVKEMEYAIVTAEDVSTPKMISYKNGQKISIADDGKYGLIVVAKDNLGNENRFFIDPRNEEQTIVIDNTAPAWNISANGTVLDEESKTIYLTDDSDDYTVVASADDSAKITSGIDYVKAELYYGSEFIASYGDGSYIDGKFNFDKSTILSALYNADSQREYADGEYSIKFTSADKSGNTSQRVVTLIKDMVKPSITVSGASETAQQSVNLLLNIVCGCSGIKNVYVKASDDDKYSVLNAENDIYQYVAKENGTYSFYVENNAGIRSEEVSAVVDNIDNTVPTVKVDATIDSKTYQSEYTNSDSPVVLKLSTEGTLGTSRFFYKLSTDSDWLPVNGDSVTVNAEGENTYDFKAISESGIESKNVTSFTVRKDFAAPVIKSITYNKNTWQGFINFVTFGIFFKDTIHVSVEVSDEVSGVAKVELGAELSENAGSDSKGYSETKTFEGSAKKNVSAEFDIPAQFRGHISVTAADLANNTVNATGEQLLSSITDEKVTDYEFIADTTNPVISFGDNIENGKYYNGKPELKIYVNEANFFGDDVNVSISSDDSSEIPNTDNLVWEVVSGKSDVYQTVIPFDCDGTYSVSVRYTDKSQNVADEKELNFTVDNEKPQISITYSEDKNSVNQKDGFKYYNGSRTAVIEILEQYFDWQENDVKITALDASGNKVDIPDISESRWEHSGNKHTLRIAYVADAKYDFVAVAHDKAGNVSDTVNEKFVIDTDAPVIDSITYSTDTFREFLNNITFRVFFKDTMHVTVKASDKTAGIGSIKLDTVPSGSVDTLDGQYSQTKAFSTVSGEETAEFDVPAQFRGRINVTIVDNAMLSTESTQAQILESFSQASGASDYEFIVDGTKPVISFGNEIKNEAYYTGTPKLTVFVKEGNFYQNDAEITITSVDDNGNPGDTPDVSNPVWSKVEKSENIYQTVIPFAADGDYTVKVAYTDKMNNKTEKTIRFTVDNKAPVVSVEYQNDAEVKKEADGVKYYTQSRTATVRVIEHNYNWSDNDVVITAVDKKGNAVRKPDLSKARWTHDGNVHELVIQYNADAEYKFSVSTSDKAGLASNTVKENFVIDKTAPKIESVSYSASTWKGFINTVTFGIFFKNSMHVTVKASDATSGVCKIELNGELSASVSSNNSKFFDSVTYEPSKYSATAEFDIPAQFRGTLEVKVTDIATNETTSDDDDVLSSVTSPKQGDGYEMIVDNIKPVISFGENITDGAFYSGNPELNVFVNEANFFGDDVKVDIFAVDINGKPSQKPDSSKLVWEKVEGLTDTYKTSISFTADGDYTVKVSYKDKSGNEAEEKSIGFIVDNTAPIINVEYSNNNVRNQHNGVKYYSEKRTATIEILERNYKWSADDVKITARNCDGKAVAVPDLSESRWTNNGNMHKLVISFDQDAEYTVDVSAQDLLGFSTSVDTEKFVVDTENPTIESIEYNVPSWKGFINTVTFGVFFKDSIDVTVKASDVTSGIKKIDFIAELSSNVSKENKPYSETKTFDTPASSQTVTFTIPAQYRGKMTVKVTDFAMRNTASTASAVLKQFEETTENYELIADNIAPEITLGDNLKNGTFYTGKPELTVTVKEANFFAEDVKITVAAVDDNGKTGTVPDTSKLNWTKVADSDDTYKAVIRFVEDGDYEVKVNYTDRSGNAAEEKSVAFTLDNTAPVISVTYDNNDVKNTANGFKYYTEYRTATVKVIEHNYNWSDKDIVITAKDVNGKELATPDVSQGRWTHNGNEHILVIKYNADAQYTFDVSTTDKAGNTSKPIETEKFVVDTANPIIDSVSYNVPTWKGFLNSVSFGIFFKDEIEVTVKTSDITSGIKRIDFTAELSENVSGVNKAYSDSKTYDVPKSAQTASFKIPAQYRGKITVKITDFATRNTASTAADILKEFEQTTDKFEFIADNIAPEITLSDNIKAGEFYTGKPELTVTVKEANFFAEDVKIEITSVDDNGKAGNVPDASKLTWTSVSGKSDTYQTVIPFTADGDYNVMVNYTDRSGNKAVEKSVSFTLDNTAPIVSVTYDNNDVKNEANGIKYYTENRTATVKITEHNYAWSSNDVIITAKDVNGKVLDTPDVSQGKWTHNGNEHTLVIRYNSDAEYTFDVSNTDKAGNMLQKIDTEHFVVDTVNPVLRSEDIVFEMISSKSEYDTKNADFTSYKFFSNGKTNVTITATDETSGISGIEAYTIDNESGNKVSYPGVKYETGKNTAVYTFTLPDDFKGYVYAEATDFSTRTSDGDADDGFTKSIGAVVETISKHKETLSGSIKAQREANEHGFYNADLPIVISVKDSYSGISKLSYKVGSSDSVVIDFQNREDVTYGWTSEELIINSERNNNNHVVVTVSYVDNAGNPHKTQQVFNVEYKIDVTSPVINVSYDNNSSQNSTFFNANRVATVTITELNFAAKDVKFKITKDGRNYPAIIPAESSWKHNGNEHTVRILYSADGDYTFDISYTDLANNPNMPVKYGDSVAPKSFTVDKTAPMIASIVYDNNSATNGNYFKNSRTATVTIREHNFSAAKAPIAITSNDDGKIIANPTPSSWRHVGDDLYSATIVFNRDALYDFDVSCTDLAGNKATPHTHQRFYIDNTDPVVTVKNIAPNSANKGTVAPVVTVTDKNIDYSQIGIEIVGAVNGKISNRGNETRTANGYTFSFENFAMKKSADDVYTIKVVARDKAGRTNTFVTAYNPNGVATRVNGNTFKFSVNRFGSAYTFDDSTRNINGNIIDKEQDVIIYENNADILKNISIVIRKNNKKIELVEGKDYRIDVSGGNNTWYTYKYTILKKNFADEAFYSVEVSSTDAAGNKSVNTLDSKQRDLAFDIDKNDPEINITNIKKNETKTVQSYEIVMYIADNIKLTNVDIILDGEKVDYKNEGDKYTITIQGATTLKESRHSLSVVAQDAVGNKTVVDVSPFYITTSQFISFLANTKLVIIALAIVTILVAILVYVIILIKRRRNDDEETA